MKAKFTKILVQLFGLFWCILIADASAQQPPPNGFQPTETDVEYGYCEVSVPGGTRNMCVADVYLPEDFPPKCINFWIHGGGWQGGDNANLRTPVAYYFRKIWIDTWGCMIVAPNFRRVTPPGSSEPVVTFRHMLTDVAAALTWAVDLAEQQGMNPRMDEALVVEGFSSGAHVAAMLATDPILLENAGQPLPFDNATYNVEKEFEREEISVVLLKDVHAYDMRRALEFMRHRCTEDDISSSIPFLEHFFALGHEVLPPPYTPPDDVLAALNNTSPAYHAAIADKLADFYIASTRVDHYPEGLPDDTGDCKEDVDGNLLELAGHISKNTGERFAQVLNDNGHYAEHIHYGELEHIHVMQLFGNPISPPGLPRPHPLTGDIKAFLERAEVLPENDVD